MFRATELLLKEANMHGMKKATRTIAPAAGEALEILGAKMLVKSDGHDAPFLAEQVLPPDYEAPPHLHDDEDEIFYVLEGTLTVSGNFDGRPWSDVRAGPGATVVLPRGTRHALRNDMDGQVRVLVICGPGPAAAAMFRELDREAKVVPLTPTRIATIAGNYGVRVG
jgi:mannose-6-phosphate isomerase-like protein (cupin superfamily)